MCEIKIVRKEKQHTKRWSGGTTTEIAIFPESALYEKRNFKWRISSARVEEEETNFTFLPGIWRKIMVIQGSLKLVHEGHHELELLPFEQDSFNGEWNTRSYGKVRDFNLMLSKGVYGEIEHINLCNDKIIELNPKQENYKNYTLGFYCVQGDCDFYIEEGSYSLKEGDFIIIDQISRDTDIKLINMDLSCHVIKAYIYY